MSETRTRLAPSPTGALHLGNARTFVLNGLLARRNGWRVLMRVEDLETPRVKAGADARMLDELRWLGLEWEDPVVYQSQRTAAYDDALQALIDGGWAYPCVCSRKDIERAGAAPHAEDTAGERPYPGTCRGRFDSAEQATAETGRPAAFRVRVDGAPITVHDEFAGPVTFDLARCGGDFVICRSGGGAAYQLAVVVDDDAACVNAIVRGDDLLDSAARQIHLRTLLGLSNDVAWWHLPLVVGPDGRRLAKRHGDTRLEHYRSGGTPPRRVLGLIAYWSGIYETRREAALEDLLAAFDPARIPNAPVTFTPADDTFLL